MKTKQVKKKPARTLKLTTLSRVELEGLRQEIDNILISSDHCNVATPILSPRSALFDTCNDDLTYTVNIDNQTLIDFQAMIGRPNEDIRKSIIALMKYYDNHEQLNILLLHDVLETRQSYVKFTAQLANYLTHQQTSYHQVKVQFDQTSSRLGIFCRKGTEASSLSSSFIGSITASLKLHNSAEVMMPDIPISYIQNKAQVKHILTYKLGKIPKIIWTKDSIKIFV